MLQTQGPIGKLIPGRPINIIGAGISGLLVGYYLKKLGHSVSIFEKESVVGGKIGTYRSENGLSEKAANAIFSNDEAIELLDELGLEYFKADRKLKKIIWRSGKPASPPFKVLEVIRIVLSLFKKIPFDKIDTCSLKDFFLPLLGPKVSNEVLAAAFGGIYAEDASKLHFKSIMKYDVPTPMSYYSYIKLVMRIKRDQKSKATSISFPGGMQTFIDALKDRLATNISVSAPKDMETLENVIICTDAHEASDILKSQSSELSFALKQIKYNSLSTATLLTKERVPFLKSSFGMLFQPTSELNSLGILSNSEMYPMRTTQDNIYSYTFIVKGEEKIADKIISDLQKINLTRLESNKVELNITPWKRGIPVYDRNRFDMIQKIRVMFESMPKGIVLFGNYIDGISIRDMLSHAKSFAQKQS
jgi:protoporphyrinogen/coproporphyrinogen III oxidase